MPDRIATAPAAIRPAPTPTATTLLVWGHGGLDAPLVAALPRLDGVTGTSVVAGDRLDVVTMRRADGTVVESTPPDWFVPLDAQVVDPNAHATFATDGDRSTVGELAPGGALLSATSASVRGLDVGSTLETAAGERLTVSGVVSDTTAGYAEILLPSSAPAGVTLVRYALVHTTDPDATRTAIADAAGDEDLRILDAADVRFRRHGDNVLPPLLLNQDFGAFSLHDVPGREYRQNAAWVDAHIVTARVPLLGRITCHEALFPPLRAAFQELVDRGRGDAVDPRTYGGCWVGRAIGASRTLSHHSWGIAIDLNVSRSDPYEASQMDPVLVEVMKAHGFVWGGDFLRPDPPHFELVVPPA